jgi:hypothetical protein
VVRRGDRTGPGRGGISEGLAVPALRRVGDECFSVGHLCGVDILAMASKAVGRRVDIKARALSSQEGAAGSQADIRLPEPMKERPHSGE